MCQSHTGRLTGLWFLPKPAFGLNTNDDDDQILQCEGVLAGGQVSMVLGESTSILETYAASSSETLIPIYQLENLKPHKRDPALNLTFHVQHVRGGGGDKVLVPLKLYPQYEVTFCVIPSELSLLKYMRPVTE